VTITFSRPKSDGLDEEKRKIPRVEGKIRRRARAEESGGIVRGLFGGRNKKKKNLNLGLIETGPGQRSALTAKRE